MMSSFVFALTFVAGLLSGPAVPDTVARASILPPSWFFGNSRLRWYDAPDVELWVSGDNLFRRGDRARVYFRTDEDAYVTIIRIDTDGRVDILFPEDPYDAAEVRGGHTYRVYGNGHESFVINDYPGLGYIFAIASWEPFDYERVSRGRSWDYRYAGGRVHGDPYVAARDFAELMLVDSRASYSFDVAEYHVERRASYPRFLCYDCHAYRPYPVWNPYSHACAKFRIVVWDDPYYYPYRRYGGRRVVYVRDRVRDPRYEFKELGRGARPTEATVVEYRRRPGATDQRRPGSPIDDPNVGSRRRGDEGVSPTGSGATRPGDEIRDEPTSGRRRPTELDRDTEADARSPIRAPRRDEPSQDARGEEGLGRGVRAPRRDAEPADAERGDRADDRVIIEDRGRREPRADEPQPEPRREEPRREEPRRETPRSEPRSEPRQEAPRDEPRRESPKSEPRRESAPKSEPRRESAPKSEPRRSTPSNERARRS